MKKIHDYLVPESWEEITINQQLTGEAIAKENPEFKQLSMLAAYCNTNIDEIKTLSFSITKELLSVLTFTSTEIPNDPISEFEYKGEKYSVVPTLLQQETQDFVTLSSLDGKPDALLYIIAVLAKKKINGKFESLSDYDLEQRAKHFEDLQITIANRIYFFFALTATLYPADSKHLIDQFNTQFNESIHSMNSTLKKQNGGGLFTRFARTTLRVYLWFLKRHWSKQYSGYNSPVEKTN